MTTQEKLQEIAEFAINDLHDSVQDYESGDDNIEGVYAATVRFQKIGSGIMGIKKALGE